MPESVPLSKMKLAQSFTNPKIRLSFWYASGHCCIFSADHLQLELTFIHSRWLNTDLWLKHLETTPARLLVALVWVVRTTRNSSISSWNLPFSYFHSESQATWDSKNLASSTTPAHHGVSWNPESQSFGSHRKGCREARSIHQLPDTHRMHCIWGYVSQSLSWLMFWLRSVLIKASKFLRHCSVSIPRTKEMNNIFSKPSPSIDLISDLRLQLLELAIL